MEGIAKSPAKLTLYAETLFISPMITEGRAVHFFLE